MVLMPRVLVLLRNEAVSEAVGEGITEEDADTAGDAGQEGGGTASQ